jgi:hypothetical protein
LTDDSSATVHHLPPSHARPKAKRSKRKATVLEWTGWTTLDSNPDRVLAKLQGELSSVVVIGETKDGHTFMASSLASAPDVLWLIECARLMVLEQD